MIFKLVIIYIYRMNYNAILTDTILGTVAITTMSYLNQIYSETNDIVRIFAFTWATPILYFFFINMFKQRGPKAIVEFSKHALLGIFFVLIAIAFTVYNINNIPLEYLVYINLFYTLFVTLCYLLFKIYEEGVL